MKTTLLTERPNPLPSSSLLLYPSRNSDLRFSTFLKRHSIEALYEWSVVNGELSIPTSAGAVLGRVGWRLFGCGWGGLGGTDMGNKACGRSIIHGSTGACSEQWLPISLNQTRPASAKTPGRWRACVQVAERWVLGRKKVKGRGARDTEGRSVESGVCGGGVRLVLSLFAPGLESRQLIDNVSWSVFSPCVIFIPLCWNLHSSFQCFDKKIDSALHCPCQMLQLNYISGVVLSYQSIRCR